MELIGKNRVKKVLTVVLIFLTLSFFVNIASTVGNVSPLTNGSSTKAPLPEIRADLPAVTHDGIVYVFGGYQDSWSLGQAEVYSYDPTADFWTQKTSMNYPRWGEAAAVYNNEAYVFGGSYQGSASSAVEAYNFASDSWETQQSLPDNVFNQGLEAVTAGSLIYLFYGSSTYSYNPQTGIYTQLANAPYNKDWADCAYVNVNGEDRIYLLGGYDLSISDATDTCAYYRPAFNNWITINAAPYAAYGTLRDNPVINGIIYYGYGQGQHDSIFYDYMYSYNPGTGVWTQLPSGVYPRDGVGCAVVGSKLYVIGGRNTWDNPILGLDYNEEFDTALFSQPSLTINPPVIRMYVNQPQIFTATTLGGTIPYSYTWYLNGNIIQGQNGQTFTFTPTTPGNYSLYATVTDANGQTAQSNTVNDFIVYNQYQANLLVPDWSNVSQDFFTLVPGATVEPVLTGASVTDRSADFVADPFIYQENGLWYMFFEVHWSSTDYSEIGLATSTNGFDWTYKQIVLSEPFSLAYPYIFKWNGSIYLIPETYSQSEVRLYKATNFPYGWTYVTSILSGQSYNPVDSSVFRYNNIWWMFTSSESDQGYLYYSYNLTDPSAWHMHPTSPINTDSMKVRGAGRTVVFDNGTVIRLTQELYGQGVRAFQVDTLTTTTYAEHEVAGSPLVQATGTSGWNAQAMHTVNPWWTGNGWVAAVDGAGYDWLWAIGIYMTPLQPSISPTALRIDVGQSQKFTSIAGGGRPPYTYQWYQNGTAVPGATGANWTFTPTQSGHYNVFVRVTDSLNNRANSNVVSDIRVYDQPSVSISPISTNKTIGGSQQFNSTITGGLAPYAYQWYYTNGTAISGATASTVVYKVNFTGTYIIYLNVTDSLNYRVQSNTATLTVYSQPTVTINPTSENMTVNTTQTFSSTTTGGLIPYSYQWYYTNGTAITGATTSTLTFKANSTGTFNIYLNVTDSLNYRVESNLAAITVYSQPSVVISPVSVNMTVGSTQQFNSSVAGGLIPYSYQWYYTNDTIITGAATSTLTYKANSTGTYNIYLNATDNLGFRVQSNTATINVYSKPTITITPTSVKMTIGATQQFNSTTTGGLIPYTYQWHQNDSAVFGATASNWNFTPVTIGHFKVYLNVTDALSFTVQSNIVTDITVNAQATVTINPTNVNMTVGGSQIFSSIVSGGTIPYSYQWYLNGTAVSGATIANWTFTPASAGTYIVYLNVTDQSALTVKSNNATASVETPMTVNISPTNVGIIIGQNQTFSSSVSGGTLPYAYQWYVNNTAVPEATSSNLTFAPTTAGNYSVYLNVTDAFNFQVQSNIVYNITVYDQPSVSISPTSANITLGESVPFNSTVSGLPPNSYQWYLNNTAIPNTTNPTYTFTPNATGTYNIYLNITYNLSYNFSIQSNMATITVYSQLTVSINPGSATINFGTSQTFESNTAGGFAPYSYQWYINNTAVSGATNPNWTFTPTSNGNYQIYVNVTDSLGNQPKSNIADINVCSVYLMLSTDQQTYSKGQQLTFIVTVLNQQNPQLVSTVALTITGPGGYGFYDFQPINVSANGVGEYSFSWVFPNVAGTYVVEVSLVPAQLTAYDAKWLEANELPTEFGYSSAHSLVVSKSLVNGVYALFVLVGGQVLSRVYSVVLPKYKGTKLRTFSRAP